jgi:hypothetical protein
MSDNSKIPGFDEPPIGDHVAGSNGAADVLAPLIPLMDICPDGPDASKTVLGHRFLCIGGSMLYVGPSGIGKSSGSVQQDVLWSLGRRAFGIPPARPLRILTIQAENDDGDLYEMREGVCRGLKLTPEDRAAVRERVFYDMECTRSGTEFLGYVDGRLGQGSFDLLRIDPLLAYLGADVNSATDTAAFLRNGLNPLLTKHGVACVLNHHTPKVTNRDTSNWRGSDWMYSGAGSADISNWARAILVIEPTHADHVFRFIAAKRGGRIGWADEEGKKQTTRHYCHASDGISWRAATDDDMEAVEEATPASKKAKSAKTPDDLLELIPVHGKIPKEVLISTVAAKAKIGVNKTRRLLTELVQSGRAFEHRISRSGTNPEIHISREK